MKNNLLVKILSLVIALLMILPAMPSNTAFAATDISNGYVTITTNNTSNSGNRTFIVESYLGGVLIDTQTKKYSGNAGNTTVTAKSGYVISNMETKQNSGGWIKFTSSSTISISSNGTTTLKIYLAENNKIADNEYITVRTSTEPNNSGNRILNIDTYIGGVKTGDTIKSYYSGNPGNTTVAAKSGYVISNMETKQNNNQPVKFTSGSSISISSSNPRTTTLSIYLAENNKIVDNEYITVRTNNGTDNGGSKVLNVDTYIGGVKVGDTATSYYSNNPGTTAVTLNSDYVISSMSLSGSGFESGDSISISNSNSKTLSIYLTSVVVDNDYVTVIANNSAIASGSRTLIVETYLGGILEETEIKQYSTNEGTGTVIINAKLGYSIASITANSAGGNNSYISFSSGSALNINNNSTRTLRIYLAEDNKIVDNEYITVRTNTAPDISGSRILNVDTYIGGVKVGDTVESYYSGNPGTTAVTLNSEYIISDMSLSGSDFESEDSISISNNNSKTLSIYLIRVVEDNDYVTVDVRNTPIDGNRTFVVETYLGGVLKETASISYSDNPGKTTVSFKSGYTISRLETKLNSGTWNEFTNGSDISISDNGTTTLRIYVVEDNKIIDNEIMTIHSNNVPNIGGTRTLNVETYVDNILEGNIISTDYSGDAGNTTVVEKSGYRITSMNTRQGSSGGWANFSTGSNLSMSSSNPTRTLRVYLERLTPKDIYINYYYDDVLQPEKARLIEDVVIGNGVNIPLEVIEGKVFQKARISDESISRNMDIATKEISFTMPNQDVILNYYYGSEGQVRLKKTATPVPNEVNEFYIDISVEGTPIVTRRAADIVLVFDKSGSMDYDLDKEWADDGPSRMDVLKDAADTFIDSIMPANEISMNQISIVTYSGTTNDGSWNDADILQPFTSSNSEAKSSYEDLDGNGGTNTQSGFMKAEEAFASSNGARDRDTVERFVIYMTDGAAGYYYNDSGNTTGTGSPGLTPNTTAVTKAITSAKALKNNTGAKIYTVALISDDVGARQVLDPTGADKYQEAYYKATTATQLTDIYSLLAAEISDEIATNAVVTDTLPDDFTFKTDALPADVVIDETGLLTWNLSTINTVEKKIRVSSKYNGSNYGLAFTNESCGISYVHKNTPDEITTKTFVVPLGVLAPVIDLPTQNVGFEGAINIDPIPSAYDNKKLNSGADKGYRVSDLEVSVYEQPNHGSVVLNPDDTFTYTANEDYVGSDSFKYKTTMEITNEFGVDPDKLCGTYTTITTVNINVEEKPTYKLTMEYAYEGGEVFSSVIHNFAPGEPYSIDSPKKTGWTALSEKVTGVMPKSDVVITIYYSRNDNILLNNSMYPNKGLKYELMGAAKSSYNVSSGINYTFGFKFKAGYDFKDVVQVFDLIKNNSVGIYNVNNFKLYENDVLVDGVLKDVLRDSKDTFEALDKSLIAEGKTYTITYNLEFISDNGRVSIILSNDYMNLNGYSNTITINASKMPDLQ